jgi:PAS domain S-box-containing protein
VRESEERFRTLANSIPQLASMARADGFILWYNQRWYDYTGTTPEQMEGWGWQSVHDPAVLPTVLSRWRDAIALAQPFEMEFPLRGADGTFRNFLTRVQPMKDSEGRLVQWFGTTTDVDQLKRIEQSLRVTQARLESTLEASSVGTWTWDIASDRLIADEFTARMFSVAAGAAAKDCPRQPICKSFMRKIARTSPTPSNARSSSAALTISNIGSGKTTEHSGGCKRGGGSSPTARATPRIFMER